MSPKLFDMQLTVVADVHDDVKHTPRSPPPPRDSPAVAVCSPTPKLSPLTVSDAYPLCGTFSRASDAAAESKLKPRLAVMVRTWTQASNRAPTGFNSQAKEAMRENSGAVCAPPVMTDDWAVQTSCVVVVHAVVSHGRPERYADGV